MQVILVFTYAPDGGGALGIYSSQELADAQIRRYVALENAIDTQINAEHDDDDPYLFEMYQEASDKDRLAFIKGMDGITSRVINVDEPIELDIPLWLKEVPVGVVLA